MCGIVGYVGNRNVVPILLGGLKRLEYRGYDSSGIVFDNHGELFLYKAEGRLNKLEQLLNKIPQQDSQDSNGNFGIGHTRWATHGKPSHENAHPHTDCTGTIAVVHNGIIENYKELKEKLTAEGHNFKSETDTEVIVHLIEKYMDGDLKQAVARALQDLEGSYAIGVISTHTPNRIIAARHFSPLVVGFGDHEYFLASDVPAILEHTKDEMIISDNELVEISQDGVEVTELSTGKHVPKPIERITWSAEQAEKRGYPHFMLKEIHEQPTAIRETLLGRVKGEENEKIKVTTLDPAKFDSIHIVACGTSYHAGLAAKYMLESVAGIPVEVELASEYRYRRIICNERTLVLPISQSGETADTLAATEQARGRGCSILGICNVAGSNLTRIADDCIFTKAGPEIGVASTKAFTSQLVALSLFTLQCGQVRGQLKADEMKMFVSALLRLPSDLERTLQREIKIQELARKYQNASTFLYLGRWISYPVALEGALKLKEISYLHAQGFAAGEMKHGPIALVEKGVPILVLAPRNHVYEKICSNIQEVRARGADVISIVDEGDRTLEADSTHIVTLPRTHPLLAPILQVVPLQLLAYHIALLRGCDIDKPRNLAKSVTVE